MQKSFKRIIRDLIIGESQYIEPYPVFRQVILSGQLALLGIFVCTLFIIIDLFSGIFITIPVLSATVAGLGGTIYWHRIGKHCRGFYFLLASVSAAVYLLASSESAETGAFVHFISIALAGHIVFGYAQRRLAILFTAIIFTLFLLSYFTEFSILPFREQNESEIQFTRIVNFSSALFSCIIGVSLLIRLNHKNAIELLDNYKSMSRANAELDRFVYSTSHDLRAPLNSILGLISITQRAKDAEEGQRYLGLMKDQVAHLDKFIQDITDYSRNNRAQVEYQKVRLASFAEEIWNLLRFIPEARDVTFELNVPRNVEVETDVNRLKTVLLNLITNALRYHDARKPNKYIRLWYQHSGNGFHIKVEDNGQGIDPQYHARIFDMFFRASEGSKGSGLGLYIVKEIVANLSGSIQIESARGVGSTFIVKLPFPK